MIAVQIMTRIQYGLMVATLTAFTLVLLLTTAARGNGQGCTSEAVSPMNTDAGCVELAPPVFQELSFKVDCQLRYHDYYNEMVHKAKSASSNVKILVNCQGQTLDFEYTSDIPITLYNVSATENIVIGVEVLPTDSNVTVRAQSITVKPYELESSNVVINYDFIYSTEGITYPLTQVEREAISSIVALEHGGGPIEAKRAIARVILNRRTNGYGSIHSIIFSGAFSTSKLVDPKTGITPYRNTNAYPYKSCKEAVDYVSLYGLENFPSSVVYFRSGHFFDWAVDYKKIGALYFSHNPKYM